MCIINNRFAELVIKNNMVVIGGKKVKEGEELGKEGRGRDRRETKRIHY